MRRANQSARIIRLLKQPHVLLFRKIPKKIQTVYFPALERESRKLWQLLRHLLPHFVLRPQQKKSSDWNVIIFSVIDWDFRFQRPQHIAQQLRNEGATVWFVSHTFFSPQFPSILAFLQPKLSLHPRIRKKEDNIYEVILPCPRSYQIYTEELTETDASELQKKLLALIRSQEMKGIVLLVEHPFWEPLVEPLPFLTIYDCMDDHSQFRITNKNISRLEKKLLACSDGIIASSQVLFNKLQKTKKPLLLLPNAGEFSHFSSNTHSPARPIIGYFGAIDSWFDEKTVATLAKKHPEWDIHLIGRVTYPPVEEALTSYPNITFFGEKAYQDLPAMVSQFSVGIIPFKNTPLIQATSPVKFFEMRGASLPVVSSPIPELTEFVDQKTLWIASTASEFERSVSRALQQGKSAPSQEFLEQQSWQQRGKALTSFLAARRPLTSIIIVSYNNFPLTKACIESIWRNTASPFEVIVVDNNSTPDTQEQLAQLHKHFPFSLMQNTSNRGFSAANNQGLEKATGEVLILLNNDTQVPAHWTERIHHHLADPTVGLLGPVTNMIGNEARIFFEEGLLPQEYLKRGTRYADSHLGETEEPAMLAGFCWAFRKDALQKVGPLDERFSVGMFEDDDFCLRFRQAGYRNVLAHDIFIYHKGRAAFSQLDRETYNTIFETNKNLFEKKWKKKWQPHQARK